MSALTHVMLVEDESDIREIAKLSLEEFGGFQVTLCESGAAALACVKTVMPQLILLDVMMPGMDGLTTLIRLRQIPEAKAIPVIFMTARVQAAQIDQYKQSGAIGSIAKPFDPVTLSQQISDLWYARAGS